MLIAAHMPDVERAAICVGGGGGRAGEHGTDQDRGGDRSRAQETSFPSRASREIGPLLVAFARYRVSMLPKNPTFRMVP